MNLVLTPLESALFQVSGGLLSLINYTIIIMASLLTAQRKKVQIVTTAIGILTLVFVWIEFFSSESTVSVCRMISTLFLFVITAYILIRNFIDAKEIKLSVIFGAMAGYILIGIIGGVLFELLDFYHPDTVNVSEGSGAYDYYYYSFISIITIGYGDITPLSAASKSLTILLSIVGQFYMAIGIALFVGKHLSGGEDKE
jgi:voltage-gated potassium channel